MCNILIKAYDWPGNVRQFGNLLKRAAYSQTSVGEAIEQEKRLLSAGQSTGDSSMQEMLRLFVPGCPEDVSPEEEIRKAYMNHVLKLFQGNRSKACKALGVAENTLRKWVN